MSLPYQCYLLICGELRQTEKTDVMTVLHLFTPAHTCSLAYLDYLSVSHYQQTVFLIQ